VAPRVALPTALLALASAPALGGPVHGLAAQEPDPPESRGAVWGTVTGRFQERTGPLPFAAVTAWTAEVHRSVAADSTGRYRLDGLPAGMVRLRVTHPGHAPAVLDVMLPGGGGTRLDVELQGQPVSLPALEVLSPERSPSARRPGDAAAVPPEVDQVALAAGTGLGAAGVARAVQSLPGNDPARATDVLFMRGSTTDLKLVLLDGAPVFTPFHVAGLLETFAPAALGHARLHVGAAPARYDGGLTYILDLRTRRPRPDRFRGSGSVDLLSAGATLDGPLGPSAGVVASARALHDVAADPLGSSPYGYRDVLLAVEAEPAEGQQVRGTAFLNRESVQLDVPGGQGGDAWWRNRALSASWDGAVGGSAAQVTVAGSDYAAALPLQPSAEEGEPRPDPLLARAGTRRLRATAEMARAGRDGVVRAGLTGERLETSYEAGRTEAAHAAHTTAEAAASGAYLDVTRRVSPELTLRVGLRADLLTGSGGGLLLAPRASVTWALAPRAFLTVAAGRYHQHARAPREEVERTLAEAAGGALAPAELLPVASSDHLVLSLDQELGDRVRLGLEGFWKGYRGLGTGGAVRSSGVDLRVQRLGDGLDVWLGYGLSWFWSPTDLAGTPADFSGRHLLTAGLDGTVAGPVGGSIRLAYGAGLPYTSIPFSGAAEELGVDSGEETRDPAEFVRDDGPLAGGVDEAFLRVDVELHTLLTPTVAGRPWRVRPYLRILNALDRRDALFYAFSRRGGGRALGARSLIPVLGVRWAF
jgi:hypothetical protein